MIEHPCHVYSDLMPSKETIGQTIMRNIGTGTSKSSPDSTQHPEWHLDTDHGVACGAHHISYIHLHKA